MQFHSSLFQILNTSVQYIKGIGPQKLSAFSEIGCLRLKDLILYIPSKIIDRSYHPPLNKIISGQIITQIVQVDEFQFPAYGKYKKINKSPLKIYCSNPSGQITVIYFNVTAQYLKKIFIVGQKIIISGKVEISFGEIQMLHPDFVLPESEINNIPIIEAIYPATARLSSKNISNAIKHAVQLLPDIQEWLPKQLMAKYGWQTWNKAIEQLHMPENITINNEKIIERLAFDEILAEQISLQIARFNNKKKPKDGLKKAGSMIAKLQDILPFSFTNDQIQAIQEITADQQSNTPMIRLLQGDVGSGKTIIAFCAMLNVYENGAQAVLMVPTEILARQHFAVLKKFADQLEINIELLISKINLKDKRRILENLSNGNIDIIVGTHALFQESVKFKDLRLVIIDEQHKFGVEQRISLLNKGENCDFLMMSATPIPRTLTMINYGDMDITTIQEKPIGRKPIHTTILSSNKINNLISSIDNIIQQNGKIYWVCPLIEESEALDLSNVKLRYESLQAKFKEKVAIIHGKIPTTEREVVMENFRSKDGNIKILIATTVIEVGVDVADANVIIIENAERFGLAQLHQLRGRVGRGEQNSYCILLYSFPISKLGRKRLDVMRDCQDGFVIAEQDLKLRGGGKIMGTQQSGIANLKIFDLNTHHYLIEDAHIFAKELFTNPKNLEAENIKNLLYIYNILTAEHNNYNLI